MSVHILGWISNIFFIYGVWALGKKKVLGFYSNTIANALYLWQSILMHNPSLAWLSIGLIFLNLYGIYQWNKDKQKKILQIPAEEVLKDIDTLGLNRETGPLFFAALHSLQGDKVMYKVASLQLLVLPATFEMALASACNTYHLV